MNPHWASPVPSIITAIGKQVLSGLMALTATSIITAIGKQVLSSLVALTATSIITAIGKQVSGSLALAGNGPHSHTGRFNGVIDSRHTQCKYQPERSGFTASHSQNLYLIRNELHVSQSI